MLGTPDFIAPEQIDDAQSADIRADIYSLGCTLYYLLSGGPPFQGETLYDILQAQHSMDAQLLNFVRPEVPAELAALVAKMMAKEPRRRFQAPDEVAKALAPFFRKKAVGAVAPGFGVSQMDTPATSLSTSEKRLLSTAPASTSAPKSSAPGGSNRPEERWKSLIDFSEEEDIRPALDTSETNTLRKRLPRFWIALAGLTGLAVILLGAVITYRITTDKGELVIETEDPDIEVVVKQRGKKVEIIDRHTKKRIELWSGSYELELQGDNPRLRLSTEKFTLERGDKEVVTVRGAPSPPAPQLKPASELLAGPGTDYVGEIARFQSPHDLVSSAHLLPDGRRVIYSSTGGYEKDQWVEPNDPAVWLGDLLDSKNPRKFTVHAPGGTGLTLSRDGRLALLTGGDKTLRLWDVETGKSRRIRHEETGFGAVAFSPDERRAAYVCGDTIRLCDLKTGDELMTLRGHAGRIRALAFCEGGRRIVSGGIDDETVRTWNPETGEEVRRIKPGHVTDIAVFPDGRRALVSSWWTIGVWDLETGQQLRRISGVANEFGATVTVSPDGRRALFGLLHDNAVRLWDLETGEPVERLEGHTGGIFSVAFSSDGHHAASASYDKTVRVWALPRCRAPGEEPSMVEVAHFLGHEDRIDSPVAVSHDSRRILTGSMDKTLILWDRETARSIKRFTGHEGNVRAVAFSPDGRHAISGGDDKVIRLWDLESGETIRQSKGHADPILSVAFSPDGLRAYSAGGGYWRDGWQDGTDFAVHVWNVQTGQEVSKLEGHKGMVWSVAASSDGRHLLSGGRDMSPIL